MPGSHGSGQTSEAETRSATSTVQRTRRKRGSVWSRFLPPVLAFAVLIGLWELYVVVGNVSPVVLPSPSEILTALIHNNAALTSAALVTTEETVLGFIAGAVLGVILAAGISASRFISTTLLPILIASQSIPKLALAPVVLLWLGYGIDSRIFIAAIVSFFPVVISTAAGLSATPKSLLELSRSLRASRMNIFFKIRLRYALPEFFSGLKVAVTLAVVGAVIGEFIGSDQGLGFIVLSATAHLGAPLAFASLVWLSVIGTVLFLLIVVWERIAVPWRNEL